ncbi:MAG: PAS domain-containing sensor histidine kinase [Anaeromyxobacter sp.]
MKRRFDDPAAREEVRQRIAGLGERSARKSYYPALQERLAELQRFRALLDGGSEGIFLVALPGGALVDVNASACKQLGAERDAVLAAGLLAAFTRPAGAAVTAALARLRPEGAPVSLQVRMARADGSSFPAEVTLVARHLDGADHAVVVARDVSEREQLLARVSTADRMIALGTLAAGVAHEINNPLTYVLTNLEVLAQDLGALETSVAGGLDPAEALRAFLGEARQAIADASEGAARVRIIANDLRAFSRADPGERRPVDPRSVLDQAIAIAGPETRRRATIVKDYAEVPPVRASGPRLVQVFVNLIVNAAQALPENQPAANTIRLAAREADGWVELAVADSGTGISPEHLERLFEPFFTTKPAGVGTGLGLAICRDIVTAHGGTITAASPPGSGAVFTVRLPAERAVASNP